MPTIRDFLNRHLSCDLAEADPLPFATATRQVRKGTVFTRYGQTEHYAYFLGSGIVEVGLLRDGEEKIVEFFLPGNFFCAYTSLLTQQPADVQVTALTDCVVEVVRGSELGAAYRTSLLANQLGRFVTEQLYLRRVKREKEFLGSSAEERYAELLRQQPTLVQHLPVDKIARYLGIHPASLSRIRRHVGESPGA